MVSASCKITKMAVMLCEANPARNELDKDTVNEVARDAVSGDPASAQHSLLYGNLQGIFSHEQER
jgi:hypothetical protein